MATDYQKELYVFLTSDDEGRVCRDIPEEACHEQPGNFVRHVLSLSATKIGDGLFDPKLVLSWLLNALGAPAYLLGFLVPVREAGALLPQLITAERIRSMSKRKWAWSFGSAVQGLAVIGIALAAFLLEGETAGITIVALLAVFALARSICSVSYKDVLGKTVSKATRGTATGTAATIASVFVLLFGLSISLGIIDKTVTNIAVILLIAGGLWIVSSAIFATLKEVEGATEGGKNPLSVVLKQFSLLKTDPQLTRFIITRALLIGTALAPPYILALAGENGGRELGELGPFVVASALAAVVSTYAWGRLSDISSRRVLIYSGLTATVALGSIVFLSLAYPGIVQIWYILPIIHFILMIAYQGVRLGRSTHLVDMSNQETRAAYVALSNTIIGVVLVGGGFFGFLAQAAGHEIVLAVFAMMALLAALTASGLKEVQSD